MELANAGNVPADWRVNMDSVKALNQENYDFEVLQVYPQQGTLQPRTQTYIHFTFTPLEATTYTCPMQVQMIRASDDTIAEELISTSCARATTQNSARTTTRWGGCR